MSDVDHERRAVELVMGTTQYAETLSRSRRPHRAHRGRPEGGLEDRADRDVGPRRRVGLAGLGPDGSVADALLRVDVDTSRLGELAELGRRHSLVFLPNHRSYLDPLVLRAATTGHGF